MSTLFMIRHGQASFGKENYDELSDLGRLQSSILGEKLHNSGLCFDAIYSGTLSRQTDTADIVLSAYTPLGFKPPDIQIMDSFNEYDSESVLRRLIPLVVDEDNGLQEHVDRILVDKNSFQKVFEIIMQKWVSGEYDLPGLITWEGFCNHVGQGIRHIMKEVGRSRTVLLSTSGGPIAVAVRKALHLSDLDTIRLSWQLVNASITSFKFTENRFMLSTFNEHSYLEKKIITYR